MISNCLIHVAATTSVNVGYRQQLTPPMLHRVDELTSRMPAMPADVAVWTSNDQASLLLAILFDNVANGREVLIPSYAFCLRSFTRVPDMDL